MNNDRGKLIVVSGPSGVGKSTVIRGLMGLRSDLAFSVSATTRPPREGEQDGVNYHFVTRERFERMVEERQLLEYAEYVDNRYGTPRAPVEAFMAEGKSVILDIEVQGALQVKRAMPEAVLIFLAPPSLEELERRLRGRGTDSEEKILGRLETARREFLHIREYDYIVFNEQWETASGELDAIITAEKCRTGNREDVFRAVLLK